MVESNEVPLGLLAPFAFNEFPEIEFIHQIFSTPS